MGLNSAPGATGGSRRRWRRLRLLIVELNRLNAAQPVGPYIARGIDAVAPRHAGILAVAESLKADLGAGLQGSACAYDLLQSDEVTEVRLADVNTRHLPHFLAPYSGKRLIPTPLDVRNAEGVRALMRESDAAMSAIPYYFNLDLARQAAEVVAGLRDEPVLTISDVDGFTQMGGIAQIFFEECY